MCVEMMKASATGTPINNKTLDIETILESDDGDGSPSSPVPSFQNVQCNSTMTLTASDETNKEEKIDYSKPALSSTFSNKSGYSSVVGFCFFYHFTVSEDIIFTIMYI